MIDRGDGPAVLLLHGQPGTGESWIPVADRLGSGYRVLAPDRPGYGRSPFEAEGMAGNADRAAALLTACGAVPATVVGHSWAGGAALLMASRHPEVVRSLVLVGSVGTPDSVNSLDRLLLQPVIGDALAAAGLIGIGSVLPRVRRHVAFRLHRGERPVRSSPASGPVAGHAGSRVARAISYLVATLPDEEIPGGWAELWGRGRRTFLTEQRALMDELGDVAAVLGAIDVPTTVMAGEWDLVVPVAAARSLAAAIPGAELVLVPGAGHFLARDAPDAVVAAIAAGARRAVD